MAVRHYISILALLLLSQLSISQTILDRPITADYFAMPVSTALDKIADQQNISFSYNPDVINADRVVTYSFVKTELSVVLDSLFQNKVKYSVAGNYVVLLPKSNADIPKRKAKKEPPITIKGTVIDSRTGEKVADVSIYQIGANYSTLTASEGDYMLSVPHTNERFGIRYTKQNYLDTIILVEPDISQLDVQLKPKEQFEELPMREIEKIEVPNPLENSTIARLIIPQEQFTYSDNFDEMEYRAAQISLVPIIGTNGMMSGAVINRFSFNVIGGYSGGIDGFEFGAMFNIVKKDVKGFQFAGFANIVGENLDGFQFGGFANNVQGNVDGFQFAGFSNVVFDTLSGFQFAGFNNTVMGGAKGMQVAGFNNISTGNSNVQAGGFVNVTTKRSNAQFAGFANYSRNVKGIQAAGFTNVATGEVKGLQTAGYFNFADSIKGLQAAGFVNVAGTAKGVQLGFINISDSLRGAPIGFFSFSRAGYHVVEIAGSDFSHIDVSFKTGTNYFYNIFKAGARVVDEDLKWYDVGYGFGSRIPLGKKWAINGGVVVSTFFDGTFDHALNLYSVGSVDIEFQPAKHFGIFAGPTYNYLMIDQSLESTHNVANQFLMPLTNTTSVTYNDFYEWVGFRAGLRF